MKKRYLRGKNFLFFVLCLMLSLPATAQTKTITGTVSDESGEALPGVTVAVKGTTTGTITDIDGKYAISLKEEAKVLVFSYIGMKPEEVFRLSDFTREEFLDMMTKGVNGHSRAVVYKKI